MEEAGGQRPHPVAGPGVDDQPGRLGQHHDVVVGVDDPEVDGFWLRRAVGLGFPLDLDLLALGQPPALGHRLTADPHRPRLDEDGNVGPAPAGEERQGPVDPLPGQGGGHRKLFPGDTPEPPGHDFQPLMAIRITPTVMALSATLKVGQWGTLMKSMTSPRRNPGERTSRSTRLPSAPPRTRASE